VYAGWVTATSVSPVIPDMIAAAAAVLLLVGLWTPLAGALVTIVQLTLAASLPGEPWMRLQLAALGGALALLGPGGCSLDARLFGRKQIQIPRR
jgi:putative oxidoreductase